ncbi:ATP-binding protein [Phocaeicola plebeius]|uniref:ATP-binding protein n=1 Tax=Phocaeicola plebeius TaxID=310297 RepID=UPI003AF18B23
MTVAIVVYKGLIPVVDRILTLQEEVIEPLHHPEEYQRYGITIPNGMLLYGPPGCGKTFFAKHFAEEVGFNFMFITPATLKSRYVNASQENIAKMFKEAEENAPTIIFIDEINELVPNREGNVHEMSKSAVNEMLAQMDRTGEKGIFIIGATNYPHMIDPAILRAGRLDKKYYVGVPDEVARKTLFELYLKNRPYDFGLDYDELSILTKNYVSADIQLIVNNAARTALKSRSKITMAILRNAIAAVRPSLDIKELQRYEEIKAQMNGENIKKSENRPKVGFR